MSYEKYSWSHRNVLLRYHTIRLQVTEGWLLQDHDFCPRFCHWTKYVVLTTELVHKHVTSVRRRPLNPEAHTKVQILHVFHNNVPEGRRHKPDTSLTPKIHAKHKMSYEKCSWSHGNVRLGYQRLVFKFQREADCYKMMVLAPLLPLIKHQACTEEPVYQGSKYR